MVVVSSPVAVTYLVNVCMYDVFVVLIEKALFDSVVTEKAFDFHAVNGSKVQSDAIVRLDQTIYF